MKEEYEDFIGIYDESVPLELCDAFVKNYELAKENSTIIDCSVENETQMPVQERTFFRSDEVAFVYPTFSTIYPRPPVNAYFK